MSGLHVLVCDDHRMMREALAAYLVSQPRIEAVSTAADVDEAIRLVRRGADVLVLDLHLAGDESGLEALEALQNLRMAIPTLVMANDNDLGLTARALALGALGYCPKTAAPQDLHAAVVEVAAGRAFIPDHVVDPLLRKLLAEMRATEEAQAVLATLTLREQEVLRLLVQGVRRQEIARRLGLAGNTVRTHLRHLMEKLGTTSQLATAARGRELLDRDRLRPPHLEHITPMIDLTEAPEHSPRSG